MRVAIDLDGVVYDFVGEFTRLARRYGILEAECDNPLPEWEFYKAWGWDRKTFLHVYALLVDNYGLLKHGPMLDNAAAEIRRLSDAGHEVIFVSDRTVGDEPGRATATWLKAHDLDGYSFHLTADKNSVEWDILLDDKPENYWAGWGRGRRVVLRDRPWNEGDKSARPEIPENPARNRAYSLKRFVDFILAVGEVENFFDHTDLLKRVPGLDVVVTPELSGEVTTIMSLQGEVRTTSTTGGQKGVKLARFDLIPTGPLFALAEHYGKGAAKYADHNWRKGYEWGKSYQALQRHATAFWGGETHDPETGSHHMAAVAFHAFALLEYAESHPEFDDRYVEASA